MTSFCAYTPFWFHFFYALVVHVCMGWRDIADVQPFRNVGSKKNNNYNYDSLFFWEIRSHQQITFGMLSGFCSLSTNHTSPLFLTNNTRLDGAIIRIKWNMHTLFILYFQFYNTSYTKLYHTATSSFVFCCFTLALTLVDTIFFCFLEHHSTLF